MLAWTAAGAVARPRTLQLRLSAAFPERVSGRAPTPSRALTAEEAAANIAWFTMPSPRGLPVDGLVLSGAGVARRPDLPALIAQARGAGVVRVVLHVSTADLPYVPAVDRCVVTARVVSPSDRDPLREALAAHPGVDVNLPLVASTLPGLEDATRIAREGGAASITYTWPFPGGESPADLSGSVAALRAAIPAAAGLPVTIKGLPACWLAELGRCTRRSANRWYVDAEHQKEAAILFFPGVVAFAKADACRFCSRDAACDGPVPEWTGRPDVPGLRALP